MIQLLGLFLQNLRFSDVYCLHKGAGGSIFIRASSVDGVGSIDVSGQSTRTMISHESHSIIQLCRLVSL